MIRFSIISIPGLLLLWLPLLISFVSLFSTPAYSADQIRTIHTVAGTGEAGSSPDGELATQAKLNGVMDVAFHPDGTLYFSEFGSQSVRKINAEGRLETVAGKGPYFTDSNGGISGHYDGDDKPATEAYLNRPSSIAFDSRGNLYIADEDNHRIRKVDSQGIITTVAGPGTPGIHNESGPATQVNLSNPQGLAVDSQDNLYIADVGNKRIRKYEPNSDHMKTIAGRWSNDRSGEGVLATSIGLGTLSDVAVDSQDNLYVTEQHPYRVRRITPNGLIYTYAGGCEKDCFSTDGHYARNSIFEEIYSIAFDARGQLFFFDGSDYRVRGISLKGMVKPVAGKRPPHPNGYGQDGDIASSVQLASVYGMSVGADGHLYLAEGNRIRMVKAEPPPILISDNEWPTVEDRATAHAFSGVPITLQPPAQDPENDPLTYVVVPDPTTLHWPSPVSGPNHGTITSSGAELVYTPNADFVGTDTFWYQAQDGEGTSNVGSFTIFVRSPIPKGEPIRPSTLANTPVSFRLRARGGVQDEPLTYVISSEPTVGALSGTPPELTYTPPPGFTGSPSFSYRVGNRFGMSEPFTVYIDVYPAEFQPNPWGAVLGPRMKETFHATLLPKIHPTPITVPAADLEIQLDGPGDWDPTTRTYTAPEEIAEPGTAILRFIHKPTGEQASATLHLRPLSDKPFTDDFNGEVDSGWGFVNPHDKSTLDWSRLPGWLTIPGPDNWNYVTGVFHTGSRLMRPVKGDFEIETRIRATPGIMQGSGGLLIWKDQNNFARLSFGSLFRSETQTDATFDVVTRPDLSRTVDTEALPGSEALLRMNRRGSVITASFSEDGTTWRLLGQRYFPDLPETVVAGIDSLDLAHYILQEPFSVSFGYFSIRNMDETDPQADEIDSYSQDVFRDEQVRVPLFLTLKDTEVTGGTLRLELEGDADESGVLRSLQKAEQLNPEQFEKIDDEMYRFNLYRPISGITPLAYVHLTTPTIFSGAKGDRPLTLHISGTLETSQGPRPLDIRLPIAVVKDRLFGDIDGNDRVDVGDVVVLLRGIVGLEQLTVEQRSYGDLSPGTSPFGYIRPFGDGRIDVQDVVSVLHRIVGLNNGTWPDP